MINSRARIRPKRGPDLIPILVLNLIQRHRQLSVAEADLLGHYGSDQLFVGGSKAEFPFVPIPEAEHLFAINVPAACFLPKLPGLDDGHKQFLGACPVHFLSDNGLDFLQNPDSQGRYV